MRSILFILALLTSLSTFAQFQKATILFKDGHTENGFVKSFIEDKLFTLGMGSLEHELNLDDKSIKFKTTENGEAAVIESNLIDEITLFYEDGDFTTFKRILLKECDSKGNIKEDGRMVFLPYIKKGAIIIYGIKYREKGTPDNPHSSIEERFYYQNAKENYAINYENFSIMDFINVRSRTINPLKDLFKDCPSMVKALDANESELTLFSKETMKEMKEKKKERKNLPKEERNTLANIHKYELYGYEKMFDEYANCK